MGPTCAVATFPLCVNFTENIRRNEMHSLQQCEKPALFSPQCEAQCPCVVICEKDKNNKQVCNSFVLILLLWSVKTTFRTIINTVCIKWNLIVKHILVFKYQKDFLIQILPVTPHTFSPKITELFVPRKVISVPSHRSNTMAQCPNTLPSSKDV